MRRSTFPPFPILIDARLTAPRFSDKVDENSPIPPPDWESYVAQIAADVVEERSPARILQVRAKFYDLLTHCIPASTVLKVRSILSFLFVCVHLVFRGLCLSFLC